MLIHLLTPYKYSPLVRNQCILKQNTQNFIIPPDNKKEIYMFSIKWKFKHYSIYQTLFQKVCFMFAAVTNCNDIVYIFIWPVSISSLGWFLNVLCHVFKKVNIYGLCFNRNTEVMCILCQSFSDILPMGRNILIFASTQK